MAMTYSADDAGVEAAWMVTGQAMTRGRARQAMDFTADERHLAEEI